jgi:small-conductance mechanosensitive channel
MATATKTARLCVFTVAIIALAGMAQAQKFPMPKAKKPVVKSEEVAAPALPQSPEQVDAFMGSLTDERARQVLAQVLKRQAAAKAAPDEGGLVIKGSDSGLGLIFYRMADNVSALMKKLFGSLTEADTESDRLGAAWHTLTGGKGIGRFFLNLLALLAILATGLLQRWLLFRSTRDIRERLFTVVRLGRLEFFGRVLSRLILEIAGMAVFAVTTFILFVLFFQKGDLGYEFVSIYLIVSYYLLLIMVAAKVIFSPDAPALRLFPMKDPDAAFFYRWLFYITAGAAVIVGASAVLGEIEANKPLYLMFYSLGGVYVTIALIAMIWKSRRRVAGLILPEFAEAGRSGPRAAFARYWHFLASAYVLCMGLYWASDVLLGGKATVGHLILSLFAIPIFIGLDQWGLRLLKLASGELTEIVDLSGDQVREVPPLGEQNKIKHYAPLIRKLYRLVLVAFLFFIVLRLWGVDLTVGRIFTSHVLSIVVTLLLGFIAWEFVKARIDSRLRHEMPAADEEMDEGGGAGGSRAGTLLLLLRKFVLTVLFVIVSLIVLSSIGVNIGPLIAGAGVIGLAIGFGAQTLVRDIIAGVFFLIDDSFRVGDYVESAGTKGTVEQISLRSIKLRNPRGMVYTIPFGNLKSVTNFSRDYTITKLDFRVGFDTDLEQVRKIIKKINKNLRKDEANNRVMLDDLKSQGVKEFDDSAMIVRVKFKTLPGKQFALKRIVYRMIQEEFRASGIEFAHRNVTVYMPPEPQVRATAAGQPATPAQPVDQNIRQAGAAAALAVIQREEEERAKALAEAKPKDE